MKPIPTIVGGLALVCTAHVAHGIWRWQRTHDSAAPAKGEVHSPSPDPPAPDPSAKVGAATSSRSPEASAESPLDSAAPPTGGDASGVFQADALALAYADDDFDASLERLLDMAPAIRGALEASQEELQALPEDFWARWPQFAHLRSGGFPGALGVMVAPEAELERMWAQDPETKARWEEHQWIAWQRARAWHRQEAAQPDQRRVYEDEIALHSSRLDELRRALWSEAGETYVFLWALERETR